MGEAKNDIILKSLDGERGGGGDIRYVILELDRYPTIEYLDIWIPIEITNINFCFYSCLW